ncbi:MAG: radical SAM protein [Chitinivibrionales bacterium]|nr:radical SAM protein [Chitinivibrionales bacterium]
MHKQSIAFIEPVGSASNVFENYMRLPLMGTLYLGTILHNCGHEVHIYNENILPRPIDPFDIKADVFCISALTVSANRARILAHEIRRIYPHARVIIGGIHASLSPETFEDVADHIVYGEAEGLIVDLVQGRIADKHVHGKPVQDLDELPLVNYSLLENSASIDVIPLMTSRGCPFDCNFCTVTKVFGKKFRMQSPQRILREIQNALSYFSTNVFFFYDDNFTANRKRVAELCRDIEEADIDIEWVTQVRSDIARHPELLSSMAKAGCRFFFIGFESISDATLKAMHKSQTRTDIEKAVGVIRAQGISIHGMFIFGDDNDTPESIQATVDFAIQHHIDTVQFMILTPFPGTRYYADIARQKRLIHQRWDYFNAMYAVFRPAQMSPSRLQEETIKAYTRFYSLRRLSVDVLRFIINITVDALTWNFSRAFNYSLDTMFLKAGARFLIGRYAQAFEGYLAFLHKIEQEAVLENASDSTISRETTIPLHQ